LGGEAGCERLSREFYARVGKDPTLRPLFPGKNLRCATEAFAAFLVQFLEGDEDRQQFRSALSLRESHTRFRIGAVHRTAWLKNMRLALETMPLTQDVRRALMELFDHSSSYVMGEEVAEPHHHEELSNRWKAQRTLDQVVATIFTGREEEA